jgi:catechol 2,3-dioxygenase-like lactoylglutathione lyase family enzyme
MTTNTKFGFKGLDHVALIVSDMEETVDFYHHKLGMPILHTLEYFNADDELEGQHWFFGVGDPSNPDAHIAMFWWKDGYQTLPQDVVTPSAKPANRRAAPVGTILHFNLRVDADRIEEYCNRLSEMDIPFRHAIRYFDPKRPHAMRAVEAFDKYIPEEEGALMTSVYVTDPSGNQVEFNAWLPGWESWPNDAVAQADPKKVLTHS